MSSTVLERPGDEETVKKLPGMARAWATERAHRLGYEPDSTLVFHLELLVSELVTNAVAHAFGAVGITLCRERSGALLLEVRDHSPTLGNTPRVVHHSSIEAATHTHGRGLLLVEALSTAWGAEMHGTGHLVWSYPDPAEVEAGQ
jgi:two-component sensor histidine kinase